MPGSGAPAIFTSKDDNGYGDIITNSTANPSYAANTALELYYNGTSVSVWNAVFRWAQCGVAAYANPGINNAIYSSAFQDCQTGVYVSMPSDTLSSRATLTATSPPPSPSTMGPSLALWPPIAVWSRSPW